MAGRSKPTAAQVEQAEARRTEMLGKLSDGIGKLCDSDEWKKYLDVQAKFHHYSFGNAMLILCQRPDATQVASFKKWLELDRAVNKGETGIRIFAPTSKKVAAPQPEAEEKDGEAQTTKAVAYATRFVLVPVFDVSQTSGEALPEPVKLLDGTDEAGVFGKLTKVAEAIGFTVQVTPEIEGHAGANGLCEYEPKRLTVAGNRSELQQVKSLAHEIGHAMLHGNREDKLTRSTVELEAESVAYVTCQSLGLETSDYSFGYVAGWKGGDPKVAQAQIKASGSRIQKASKQILDELEAQAEATVQPAETVTQPERQAEDREMEMSA